VHDIVRPRTAWRRLLWAAAGALGLLTSFLVVAAAPASAASGPTVTAVAPSNGPVASPISEATGTDFPQNSESPGNSALTIDPANVGDLVVISMQVHSTAVLINGITGGHVGSWQKAESYDNDVGDTLHYEVWWGVATGTGLAGVTISYSGPASSYEIELIADSFSSTSSTWSLVSAGGSSGSGSPATFPSLTSGAQAQQLYWGASEQESSGSAGSTSGFTYRVTGQKNCYLFNAALAPDSAYSPSCNVSGGNYWTAVGVIFSASVDSVPFVSAVSPNSGPPSGGTTVTVSGANFTGATAVHFGSAAATGVNVLSDTALTAVAPPGSGTVDVTVTTPGGTSPATGGDRYSYVNTSASTTGSYDMVGSDGGVFVFPVGGSGFYGSLPGLGIHVNDIVGIVPTSDGRGYWLVGTDGGVFAFGDATYVQSLPGLGVHVNDIAGIVPTSDGKGYWLVGRDGGVFAFGDATYVQSLPGLGVHVNNIVGIAPTITNNGYWLLGSDGAVYALGDAPYYGGAYPSSVPLVGIAEAAGGNGYWLVASNGKVANFGSAGGYGDLPTLGVSANDVVSIVPTPDGAGYWLIGRDGGVFAFGDAGFVGSLPGIGVHVSNVVGAVPTA